LILSPLFLSETLRITLRNFALIPFLPDDLTLKSQKTHPFAKIHSHSQSIRSTSQSIHSTSQSIHSTSQSIRSTSQSIRSTSQ
jgi:hypothetical protein